MRMLIFRIAVFLLMVLVALGGDCAMHNNCNGHGTCNTGTSSCECYEGYGASTDITFYWSPDCSSRTCPSGRAWADVPLSATVGHSAAECSNRGVCDRATGLCDCFVGFTGPSCNRNSCPNDCSGHGECMNLKQLAKQSNALPLNTNTFYEGEEDGATWDEDMIYGCVCDSSWSVGLASGERQEPEWFGPDCSLRHCPSADDPKTTPDETDCEDKAAKGSTAVGAAGNVCQVDCANRGLCNYGTGTCQCFNGFYGVDCTKQDIRATYAIWG
jgi:hypothetical protein